MTSILRAAQKKRINTSNVDDTDDDDKKWKLKVGQSATNTHNTTHTHMFICAL